MKTRCFGYKPLAAFQRGTYYLCALCLYPSHQLLDSSNTVPHVQSSDDLERQPDTTVGHCTDFLRSSSNTSGTDTRQALTFELHRRPLSVPLRAAEAGTWTHMEFTHLHCTSLLNSAAPPSP